MRGKHVRIRLSAVAVVVASTLLFAATAQGVRPTSGGSESRTAAAGGGTTFNPKTGEITVNVDLIGAEDANGNEIKFTNPDDGKLETAKQAWEQKVNDIWNGLLKNGGFKKFLFHATCPGGNEAPGYRLHMNFVLNPLPPGSKGSPGHHHITFVDEHLRANVTNRVVPPGSKYDQKTNSNAHNLDGPFPYEQEDHGQWGVDSAVAIAHEVGHLLGLGDDDIRVNNQGTGKAYDGRASDTIMYGGRKFDKVNRDLVDRIAKQIQKNYKIPKDCGDYRYDISIVATVRDQVPAVANVSSQTSDSTFTWTGDFPDVPIKVKLKNGKLSSFRIASAAASYPGVLRPGDLKFSGSDGSESCSGLLDTLPAYPTSLTFAGTASSMGFQTQLHGSALVGDLYRLANDQEVAFGCPEVPGYGETLILPGPMPELPDIPTVLDADGFIWRPYESTDLLKTDVQWARSGKGALPTPIARLAAGKSFSFYSGDFVRSVTVGYAGGTLIEHYSSIVTFTRDR